MIKDQQISPKLSKRFSDLFGEDDSFERMSRDDSPALLYFEESRKLNLNKLLHLAPYSEVLLLLGTQAVGRTTLLKAFVERAASTWRISFVTANALMDSEVILRQIASGFGIKIDDIDSVDGLLWEVERYLQALGRTNRRAIIIIDDAHLLTDDVILLVEKILADERTNNSVSLVLSMRKDQGSKLDRFTLLKKKLAYTLDIEPFSRKEITGYLRQRLAHAAVDVDTMLTAELIDDVEQKSQGIPEAINAQAHEILLDLKKSTASSGTGKSLVKGVLALVLVSIIVGMLYYQEDINQMLALPEQSDSVVDELSPDEKIPAEDLAPPPLPQPETSPARVLDVPEIAEQTADAHDQPAVSPSGDEQVQPPVGDNVLPWAEDIDLSGSVVTEPESDPASETDSVMPGILARIEPPVSTKPPPPEPEAPELPSPARLEWLMAQPEEHYTMQLLALIDSDKVDSLASKWNITDQSATYPVIRRNKVLTVLVYGSYPDFAAANKVAQSLPKSWRVGQPWVRKFASVRKDFTPE